MRIQRRFDMGAIGVHFDKRGSCDQPARRARMPCAFGFIIAVEQIGEAVVKRPVSGDMVPQDEAFEEPCHMRQMPFGRGRIRHRLNGRIRIGKRFDQIDGQFTCVKKPVTKGARHRDAPGTHNISPFRDALITRHRTKR